MITGPQIRNGRGLLSWTARKLAHEARVPVASVDRAERAGGEPHLTIERVKAIRAALEAAGVEFIPHNGSGASVRLRKDVVS